MPASRLPANRRPLPRQRSAATPTLTGQSAVAQPARRPARTEPAGQRRVTGSARATTRSVEARIASTSSAAGRIGRGSRLPPQLGQTPCRSSRRSRGTRCTRRCRSSRRVTPAAGHGRSTRSWGEARASGPACQTQRTWRALPSSYAAWPDSDAGVPVSHQAPDSVQVGLGDPADHDRRPLLGDRRRARGGVGRPEAVDGHRRRPSSTWQPSERGVRGEVDGAARRPRPGRGSRRAGC